MDEREQLNRKRQARIRLRAQRRRVGVLRTRVITISVVCFALLWAVVFVQMATGNDPVIGQGRRTAGLTATPPESRTDSEEAGRAAAGAVEAIETTAPEETEPEPEVVEPEPVEVEVIEPEPEPEPVPIETAQS